nr:hypothetical protein [Tanacetum cinerariifolium]
MAQDGSVFRYDLDYLHEQFAGLVIQRALPFNHFDYEQTTRVFQSTMQPTYTHVSRSTLKRDAMKLWLVAKQEIIDSFGNINAFVNLTTELLMGCPVLTYKVMSITLNNASNNTSAMDKLKLEYDPPMGVNKTRSGNTTTHADNSLPEYDSFCFEIKPDQERLTNLVKNDISDDSSNDPLLEEADLFLVFDNSIPPGIENFADDSEGDIRFLEELLIDDSILSHESSDSSFEDNPSIPQPPPEPPDDETDAGEEISVVMNNKDKLTAAAKSKQPAKAKSPSDPSEVARTEAQQLKIVLRRSRQQTYISQLGGFGTDEGTCSKPRVSDVPSDDSKEEISWNSSDDEHTNAQEKDGDDDEGDERGENDDEEEDDVEEKDGDERDDDDDDE